MKVLVVSDSHGYVGNIIQMIDRWQPARLIHLGDGYNDMEQITYLYPKLPIIQVPGNCDFFVDSPKETTVTLQGVTLFLCHGHTRGVKRDLQSAYYAAREAGAQVLLFGHTHQPLHDNLGDLLVVNPGSIGYEGRYAMLELKKGTIRCDLHQT